MLGRKAGRQEMILNNMMSYPLMYDIQTQKEEKEVKVVERKLGRRWAERKGRVKETR